MSQEPTMLDVLEAVQSLATHMDVRFTTVDQKLVGHDQQFVGITQKLTEHDQQFVGITQKLTEHDQQFVGVDRQFSQLRTDMEHGFSNVRSEMGHMKNELITHIDGFVVLHQTLDVELVSLRSRCERMETYMVKVGEKLEMEYNPT